MINETAAISSSMPSTRSFPPIPAWLGTHINSTTNWSKLFFADILRDHNASSELKLWVRIQQSRDSLVFSNNKELSNASIFVAVNQSFFVFYLYIELHTYLVGLLCYFSKNKLIILNFTERTDMSWVHYILLQKINNFLLLKL
jgi:hypothetical protein